MLGYQNPKIMVKTFPKTRICVIDVYPLFEQSLKKAINFSKKHNISLSSSDGKKILLSYCLKDIEAVYKETKSDYPKVLALNSNQTNPRLRHFIDNQFDRMMEYLPAPYCGKLNFNSPDLEFIAEKSLKKYKTQKRYSKFLQTLGLK